MAARLLYTGQVVIDLAVTVDTLPTAGQDVLASTAVFAVGGGFNVMAAAARHGLQVSYLGRHGGGRFGEMAREAMTREGIDIHLPPSCDEDTGLSVALTDRTAERSFVSQVGAEGVLLDGDLEGVRPGREDWLMVSGYSLMHSRKREALLTWLQRQQGESPLVFDPGPLAADPESAAVTRLLPHVDIWSSNADEVRRFTGAQALEEALTRLARRLPRSALLVVRDGARGCWLSDAGQRIAVPGFAVTAVDSNGAGDAHVGVFLAGLASGHTARQAAVRANAAAAIAVTRYGPATCPGRAELDAFLACRQIPAG